MVALINATLTNPAINLKTLLANPDKIVLFSEKIQQQTPNAVQDSGDTYA